MDIQTSRSLQDIIKRRQQYDFVGRDQFVNNFRENLTLSLDDERRRFIYNVFGPAGVGKTWLLRRFNSLAQQSGVVTAWTDATEADAIAVMEQIAARFEAQGRSMAVFTERLRVHRRSLAIAERSPSVADATVERLSFSLENLSPSGGRFGIGRPVASCSQAAEADAKAVNDALGMLTPLFVGALRVVAEECPIGLFFDSYERTSRYLDDWIRGIVEGRYGELPASTIIGIAGQEKLDGNRWGGIETVIAPVSLEPFTDGEARVFLAHKGITEEPTVTTILRVSDRLPVLLATAALGARDRREPIDETAVDAIDLFLRTLDDPGRRSILLGAALPRHLDADLLAHVIGRSEAGPLVSWLRNLPFVEQRAGTWIYRDVVRDLLVQRTRQDSPRQWCELHAHLAEYYDRLAAGLGLDRTSRWRDPAWQGYALEALYHRLCQSPRDSLPLALSGFVTAFSDQQSYARRWANTILHAAKDADDSELRAWGERLLEGLRRCDEGRYEMAVDTFGCLLDTANLDDQNRAEALAWYGRLLCAAGRTDLALRVYTDLVRIAPTVARYWVEAGVVQARLGHHQKAVEDFGRALAIDPTNTPALANRGEAYRLLEAYDEALADFGRVLELEPENAQVLGSRGQVYVALECFDDALADLNRALDLAPDEVWILAERGSAYRSVGRYEEAMTDLNHVLGLDPGNVWALVVRGDVYWQTNRHEAARFDFHRALGLQQQPA